MKFAIITPVDRYLGFSAPISPTTQFDQAVAKFTDVKVVYIDPQRASVFSDANSNPVLIDGNGNEIKADVYFAFSHTALDRQMTRYIIKALEKAETIVINGYKALTVADDKALLAIELSKSGLPIAKSFITSARSNSRKILRTLNNDSQYVIAKTSGLTAGGVGVKPVPKNVDCLAPELWASRLENRPKIIQNDLDYGSNRRTVIRSYIVGGKILGSYTTTGFGIVNCAGLTRESKAIRYEPTEMETEIIEKAAATVYSSGYCRVDSVGGKNFAIIEINPVARIDADTFGIDVPSALIKYAKELYEKSKI